MPRRFNDRPLTSSTRLGPDELNRYIVAFDTAIAARKEQGFSLDNRLVAIDQSVIAAASLEGSIAELVVRFEADIAAVTRNAEGDVVA